ncbi:ATP-dependent DNA helicase RecQ-like [Ylistrum balloti]|uniref:ATP-dependent DNA helicase RecQ-like n=1 Tax=Ylistrum balloti TaxID=509963 RepID=UPI002905ABBA|nr:ATP-dependent DNA helicase RecQ-like [Ylistrum balloti]
MDITELKEKFNTVKGRYNIKFEPKPEQFEAAKCIIEKKNVIGLLPTGYGKTFCAVLSAMLADIANPITLVISPLRALMDDQINSLHYWNFTAAKIEPDMDPEIIKGIKEGTFNFVFSSPETALKPFWKDIFMSNVWRENTIALVVDEVHCVSEWGEDFRRDFRYLHELRSAIHAPVLALTATSTEAVKQDIKKYLQIDDAVIIDKSPDRPNIFLDFKKADSTDLEEKLDWLLTHLREKSSAAKKIIVYCRSIDRVADVFILLRRSLGIDAYVDNIKHSNHAIIEMFHRSIHEESKTRIIKNFKDTNSNLRCLIATVALGMGIQIDDVDIVMHIGSPKSILSYWQEAGRCARDGRPGYSFVLYDNFTLSAKGTNKDMKSIVEGDTCFRKTILKYLGDKADHTVLENACGGDCDTERCLCHKCMCCSRCQQQCPCKVKQFDVNKFADLTDGPTDPLY